MGQLDIRPASVDDLPAILRMLADDPLGAQRETPDDLSPYLTAHRRLAEDPNQQLVVAERDGRVIGTLQLTVIPGLSHQGSSRAQIESVRIDSAERGNGLGTELIGWAVEEAGRQGCRIVQLTSSSSRAGAHRFYERLGFKATHVGFKLSL